MSAQDKRSVVVNGRSMAYVERGVGDPIVFLHGNPTSSYLWRTVIPEVEHLGRCLAPDLIGMGDSDKLPDSGPRSYTYVQHRELLGGWFEAVGATRSVTLVVHDWGSALGFDWAFGHPGAIRGIAYMEAIVRPLTWAEWPAAAIDIFKAFRSPLGEEMVLDKNLFVEAVLPASVLTPLSPEAHEEYRRPFAEPGEGRRPTLTWPRQIPIDGEPADVDAIVRSYGEWLASSPVPKLFVNAEPGAILVGSPRDWCRTWPNQREVTVPGIHFVQEDSGPQIGRAIADWLAPLLG
jgi:haloalkane dehalogenase